MIIFDERLDKCPLCGGNCYYEEKYIYSTTVINIACQDCGLRGYKNFSKLTQLDKVQTAIDYWNNRKTN